MSLLSAALVLPFLSPALTIPVSEDASLIQQSYAYPNAADLNFGSSEEISVGTYHITAEGLFKLPLGSLNPEAIEKAELVIHAPRVVGSFPSAFSVTKTSADWSESEVTWNTKPTDEAIVGEISLGVEDASLDLTDLVLASLANGEDALSLKISSKSSASLFLESKEKDAEDPAVYLKITEKPSEAVQNETEQGTL